MLDQQRVDQSPPQTPSQQALTKTDIRTLTQGFFGKDIATHLPSTEFNFNRCKNRTPALFELTTALLPALPSLLSSIETQTTTHENNLNQGLDTHPEDSQITRIKETIAGIRAFLAVVTNKENFQMIPTHKPHSASFSRTDGNKSFAPAVNIAYRPLQLLSGKHQPSFGQTYHTLRHELQAAVKKPGAHPLSSPEEVATQITQDWERSQTEGLLVINWGRRPNGQFIPADTHAEIRVHYHHHNGILLTPSLHTYLTDKTSTTHFQAEAPSHPLANFTNLQNLNQQLALKPQ